MHPSVTIALATWNGGALLARLLEAVRAQRPARPLEIIALDSGSTDGTPRLLAQHGARVLEQDGPFNWGAARERLFAASQGEIIACLSQDAIPAHEDWLENLIRPLQETGVGASCGPSTPDPERAYPQFPWERNGYFYFTREMRRYAARHGRGMSFANAAVLRSVWERFHFTPQILGEDFQFQLKLETGGLRVAFPAHAAVLHHHTYTLHMLAIRCRNEGAALRDLGFPYSVFDCLRDLATPRVYLQWLREAAHGRLDGPAAWLFPFVRPLGVYLGCQHVQRYQRY